MNCDNFKKIKMELYFYTNIIKLFKKLLKLKILLKCII